MVRIQNQVINVLLKSLLDQGLISEKMYEAAANRIHSMEIRQEFFRHSDHRNGEEDHGCS